MDSSADDKGPFNVLFVCTGNTCRSPMAEVIARREIERLGWQEIAVRSAGVGAFDGSVASGGAVRAAARRGLDLGAHRSTRLTPELADWADLVLVMAPHHLVRLVELGAGERAALLTSFAASDGAVDVPEYVPDPIGGADDEYEETFRLLEALVERALRRLEPVVAP